MSTMRNDHRCR